MENASTPEGQAQTVKAWLNGRPDDLLNLAGMFAEGAVRVVHDDQKNAYYLTAPEIGSPSEPNNEAAKALIGRLNGLARAHRRNYRPVSITHRYTSSTGTYVVVPTARIEVIGVAPTVGVPGPSQPSPFPKRAALAAVNADVDEAIGIMGRGEPLGWADLYKVYEIVSHAVRPDSITKLEWTDNHTAAAFRASANRADVSGEAARHARNTGPRPTRTMSLDAGRAFIGHLVTQWMDHLIQQEDLPTAG